MTILLVVAAAIIRIVLLQDLGDRVAFLTFYPAVIFSALYGGLWAGLLATALSALLVDYYIITPHEIFLTANTVDMISFLIFIFNGAIISYLTEKLKQTQSKLISFRSEQQFHTMVDAIPQLAWIAKPDGYIYWYNHRWYEYTGTTPKQMEGWGWQRVQNPEILPHVLEKWKRSISLGDPFEMEFPLRGSDGTFRPFLTLVMPFKDSNGHVIQWFGTNTDITERKNFEERLEKTVTQRTAQVRTLSKALIESEYRERKHFSAILHDDLQQILFGAKLQFDLFKTFFSNLNKDNELNEDLQLGLKMLDKALRLTKSISLDLNPPILKEQGLDFALSWLSSHIKESSGLSVDLTIDDSIKNVRNETQIMLTQFVRELLTNVAKHAGVLQTRVEAKLHDKLIIIVISDKGQGFDVKKTYDLQNQKAPKPGLATMRDRLQLFGGNLVEVIRKRCSSQ